MHVSPHSAQLAALAPLGFLMVADGPTSSIALWGMFLTLIAGLVGRWLDIRKEENRHKWEIEERAAQAAAIRADLVAHRDELTRAMAENTAITNAVLAKQRTNADKQTAQVDGLRTQLTEEHEENKGLIAEGLAAAARP
jgi:hypothetical protein